MFYKSKKVIKIFCRKFPKLPENTTIPRHSVSHNRWLYTNPSHHRESNLDVEPGNWRFNMINWFAALCSVICTWIIPPPPPPRQFTKESCQDNVAFSHTRASLMQTNHTAKHEWKKKSPNYWPNNLSTWHFQLSCLNTNLEVLYL